MKQNARTLLTHLILLTIICWTHESHTQQVNHQTGALDISTFDQLPELSIRRDYSSRSLHRGLFGYGWCSNLDVSIKFTSDKAIDLYECDRPIARFERSTPTIYRLPYRLSQTLVSNGDAWFLSQGTDLLFTFSREGNFLGIKIKDAWIIRLDVLSGFGRYAVTLDFDRKLIKSIKGAGASFYYSYSDLNLATVNSDKSLVAAYAYDSSNNLVSIQNHEGLTRLEYDVKQDRVDKILRANGTHTQFTYDFKASLANTGETHFLFVSEVEEKMGINTDAKFSQFFYQQDSTGTFHLKRARLSLYKGSEPIEVLYSQLGTPAYIRLNGKAYKLFFNLDKKVSELRWDNESYLFSYNHPSGKLTAITERNLKLHVTTKTVNFIYDRNGRLVSPLAVPVLHPFDLQKIESEIAFKELIPFEPVRALAALK